MCEQRALLSEDVVSCPLGRIIERFCLFHMNASVVILIPGWIRRKKKKNKVTSLVVCHVPETLLICSSNDNTMAMTAATSW